MLIVNKAFLVRILLNPPPPLNINASPWFERSWFQYEVFAKQKKKECSTNYYYLQWTRFGGQNRDVVQRLGAVHQIHARSSCLRYGA
jgi:hypothetical protein